MTEFVPIEPGDFVVVNERWRVTVSQASKVTAQCFWSKRWGNTENRQARGNVIFAGPEQVARKLAERLLSSSALEDEETQKSRTRRQKRDEEFIARANAEKNNPVVLAS